MPPRVDKIKIDSPFLDRRIKMLPCQKEQVPVLYKRGMSITKIAKMYGVNKRGVQFIIFPERLEKNKQDREDRGGWKQYYSKTKNTETIRDHRAYKNSIL